MGKEWESSTRQNRPNILYRGIRLDYNAIQDFKFTGVDLVVNYDPIIDKNGRPTVKDGNEYGVYMSDNPTMVENVYGDLHNDGIPIHKNISINNQYIMIPAVAVIYKIDTKGLDIRTPRITSYLTGDYNNHFKGDEWITDSVPASNYTLYRVRIGKDIIHDAEDIDLSKHEDVSEQVKKKLEMRKYRLETFANAMERIPFNKRNTFNYETLEILKTIYGEDGLKYINEENIDTSKKDGMLNYLTAKTFKKDEANINFSTLKYIYDLRKRTTSLDSIMDVLQADKIKNTQNKETLIERKKQEGVPYKPGYFERQEEMYDNLMELFLTRQKKDKFKQEQHKQAIGEVERLLDFKITPNQYIYDENSKNSKIIPKNTSTLNLEFADLKQKIQRLYDENGSFDLKTLRSLQLELYKEYENMKKDAPRPVSLPVEEDKTDSMEEDTPKPDLLPVEEEKIDSDYNLLEQQMREKYGYDEMSDDERELFNQKLETMLEPHIDTPLVDSLQESQEGEFGQRIM